MTGRHPFGTLLKKNFLLLIFFVFFNIIIYFFTFMENINRCFPATVITTDRSIIDNMIDELDVCSMSVDTEKMTFDSEIFNHYEVPPVKDVYLFSLTFPYKNWNKIKKLDNAISDTNPYVEKTITTYNESRIKLLSTGFILIFILWLFFIAKIAPSWKKSRRSFFTTASSTLILFTFLSLISYTTAAPEIHFFVIMSISLLFISYIVTLSLIYRFILIGAKA